MAKKDKKQKAEKNAKTTEATFEPYRVWLAGIGAAARARAGDAKLYESLVEEGRDAISDRGKKVKKKVQKMGDDIRLWFDSTREDVGTRLNQALSDAVHSAGVPTTDVIESLSRKVEELTERLASMEAAVPAEGQEVEIEVLFDGEQWVVRAGGATAESHATKAPAVTAAKALAADCAPCTLVVYKKDGAEQSRTEVE
jgi:poly(hydroxyalkanoate) granule-associated protein